MSWCRDKVDECITMVSWCRNKGGDKEEIIETFGMNKAQLLSKDDYGIKYNASLWIPDTSEHDIGTYSCIVTTPRLIEESIVVQDYDYYPSITVSSRVYNYSFNQNKKDNITLRCPNEVRFRH